MTDLLTCPCCAGEGVLLGRLGQRIHYRCRDCGGDWHIARAELKAASPYPEFCHRPELCTPVGRCTAEICCND